MAREIKSVTIESLLSNAEKMGELALAGREDQAIVPAKELTYSPPPTDWEFTADGTAEFKGTKPQVSGKYDVKNLIQDKTYEVYFWVAMNDHVVENPVNLKLQLPNKDYREHNTTLTIYPDNWIAVPVGEFKNIFDDGDITFTFTGKLGNDSWTGLLIKGAIIAMSNK